MSERKYHLADGCLIVVIGFVSLVVSAYFFMPNIEAGRNEVRTERAWNEVRIRQLILEETIDESVYRPSLSETDPWGKPYKIETLPDDTIRVISTGPNTTTPERGFDEDDIYSDMPESPLKSFHAARKRQWVFVLTIASVGWIGLSFLWLRVRNSLTD